MKAFFKIIALSFFATMTLSACTESEPAKDVNPHTVVKVGGCSQPGNCGVQLDDGTFAVAKWPVEGLKVCGTDTNFYNGIIRMMDWCTKQ